MTLKKLTCFAYILLATNTHIIHKNSTNSGGHIDKDEVRNHSCLNKFSQTNHLPQHANMTHIIYTTNNNPDGTTSSASGIRGRVERELQLWLSDRNSWPGTNRTRSDWHQGDTRHCGIDG